jgi:hypothetical protein
MRKIHAFLDLDAPPETVWEHLVDLDAYPDWNPHVTRAEGTLRVGERLRIRVAREGTTERTMPVRVTEYEPGRRLTWVGRLGHPLLFEGRHTLELEPLPDGGTRLHNREAVTGLLARFLLTDEPERDYEAMNRALKRRVEDGAAVPDAE